MANALLKGLLALVAILAGCDINMPKGGPAYGVEPLYCSPPPSEAPDPELQLVDFSYEPASPVALGEEITFRATANKPFADYFLFARIGEDYPAFDWELELALAARLLDDGVPPDQIAGDGVFSGSLTLPLSMGAHEDLPVIARVTWPSTAPAPEITGAPLTVVEPEEEQ